MNKSHAKLPVWRAGCSGAFWGRVRALARPEGRRAQCLKASYASLGRRWRTPQFNLEAYQKLYRKCEDWARRRRLDADSNVINQEIGGVDGEGGEEQDEEGGYDEYGNW